MDRLYKYDHCLICGSQELRPFWEKDGHTTSRCLSCGFVFVNPVFSQEVYEEYYNQEYLNSPLSSKGELDGTRYLDYERERSLEVFESYYKRFIYPFFNDSCGCVFDVGCSTGTFLQLMESKGWLINGQEINQVAAAIAIRKLGNRVQYGHLNTIDRSKKYDLVTLWDVAEHFYHPVEDLTNAADLCKVGGRMIIETVNIDDPMVRWVYKQKWANFQPRVHLAYWSTKTLADALKALNFEIIDIITYPAMGNAFDFLKRQYEITFRWVIWGLSYIRRSTLRALGHQIAFRPFPSRQWNQLLLCDDQTVIAQKKLEDS
jgi:2-polyprenyl-3-methyl-5-hydroxy-6-metoxy-1,4-benzoquinol methylase